MEGDTRMSALVALSTARKHEMTEGKWASLRNAHADLTRERPCTQASRITQHVSPSCPADSLPRRLPALQTPCPADSLPCRLPAPQTPCSADSLPCRLPALQTPCPAESLSSLPMANPRHTNPLAFHLLHKLVGRQVLAYADGKTSRHWKGRKERDMSQ